MSSVSYMVQELGDLVAREASISAEIAVLEASRGFGVSSVADLEVKLEKAREHLKALETLMVVDPDNPTASHSVDVLRDRVAELEESIEKAKYGDDKLERLKSKRESIKQRIETLRAEINAAVGV